MDHKLKFLNTIVHLPESILRKDRRRTAHTKIPSFLCDDISSGLIIQIFDICDEYVLLNGIQCKLCRIFVELLGFDDLYKGLYFPITTHSLYIP
jgi:hypothetical protein